MFLLAQPSIDCPPLLRGPSADPCSTLCSSGPQVLLRETAFYTGSVLLVLLHGNFWLRGRLWLLPLLNFLRFLSAHFSNITLDGHPAYQPFHTNVASSTNLLRVPYVPLPGLLIEMQNSAAAAALTPEECC